MRWNLTSGAGLTLLTAFALQCRAQRTAYTLELVRQGQPAAAIVIAQAPTRVAQLAAFELQHHVELITGVQLPLLKDKPAVDGVNLFVGPSAGTAALGMSASSLSTQEYTIEFHPKALVLMGRDKQDVGEVKYAAADPFAFRTWPDLFDEQGTLYAVYDFLERFCAVRWFTPTEIGMDHPKASTLTVTGTGVRRQPAFAYRDCGWIMDMSENYEGVTGLWPRTSEEAKAYEAAAYPSLHQRFPNHWQYVHAKRGGARLFLHRMRLGGQRYRANHSFYGFYDRFWEKNEKSPDVFVGTRPSWFAQGYESKPPQMCYTNPEFAAQVIEDARDYFDGKGAQPRAVAFGDYFALVPMDNSGYCKCDACQACRNDAEASSPFFSNGLWSDYVFGFANRVAREVRKTHPDKLLATLAYSKYAKYPAHTVLEDNIAVQLCLHVRNTYDRAMQRNDLDILESWATREKNRPIFLWLYYCFPAACGQRTGWHVFPGFFAHQIAESFALYQRYGIRGAFFNGFGQDVDAYVTFKYLDDSTRGLDTLLDEYFGRYFGAAAEPMKRFYLTVERAYSEPGNYPMRVEGKPIGHQTEEMAWRYLGTPERMAELGALVQQARELARTDVEKRRLQLFEKGIWDYMWTGPRRVARIEDPEHPQVRATVERLLFRQPSMASDDALHGKPFVLETPGAYFAWQGKTTFAKGQSITGLTNGDVADSIFLHHRDVVAFGLVCELGPVPDNGRQLRTLRVCWTLGDSQRSRIHLRFAIRNSDTREWRDITGYLTIKQWEQAKPDSYHVLTVEFPPDAVTDFDALRLTDGTRLLGFNTTRFTELDAVITPRRLAKGDAVAPGTAR